MEYRLIVPAEIFDENNTGKVNEEEIELKILDKYEPSEKDRSLKL